MTFFTDDEIIKALPLLERTRAMTAMFAHKYSPGLAEEFLYNHVIVDAAACVDWMGRIIDYYRETNRPEVANRLLDLQGIAMNLHAEEVARREPRMEVEITGELLQKPGYFVVALSSCGNPDYNQNPDMALPGVEATYVPVNSLGEASSMARQYIAEHDLGGGNWSGGAVKNKQGKVVARVSYNGRVWTGEGIDPWAIEKRAPRAPANGMSI